MIRLRHTLERARRRPSAGPLALFVLLLLLVLVALAAIHDARHAAVDAAPFCVALLAVSTLLARPSVRRRRGEERAPRPADRGSPCPVGAGCVLSRGLTAPLVVPLRR